MTGGGQLRLPVSLLHGSLIVSEDGFTVNARAENKTEKCFGRPCLLLHLHGAIVKNPRGVNNRRY